MIIFRLPVFLKSLSLGLAAVLWGGTAAPVWAHDEHDNLPSTGAAVRGDRLILSPTAEKALGIKTATVRLKNIERDVMANGEVEVPWRQHAYVTTLVAGRIANVHIQPGDKVAAGQELASVESAEIESLQLDLLKASTELEMATKVVAQRAGLAQAGSMSERRLLESQAVEARWAAARGIATRKLLSLGFTSGMVDEVLTTSKPIRTVPVTAPIGGVISAAHVYAGQVVNPWQQVYEIVDLATVWLHGQVLESDCTAVTEGAPVEIRLDALPDNVFNGVVDHLGVKLDPESRSLHVHVEVPNPDGLLREGMFGRLRIRATVAPEAVACPVEALVDVASKPSVLVWERPGVYVRQPVRLGLRSGSFVEILDGVFPGDPVVTVGKQELASLFSAAAVPGSRAAQNAGSASSAAAAATGAVAPLVAQAQIELPTDKKATAFATVTGRIRSVLVEHGQRVAAGEILAEVESLELRNVELDLLQAQSRLTLSEQLLTRYRLLNETGAIALKELWQAETDTTNLRATVDSLKNKLSLLGLDDAEIQRISQLELDDSTATDAISTTFQVRAPLDGRITIFDLSIGQVVRPQDGLFEIHDTSRVLVRGYVHEQDSADVHVGEPVTVTITADPTFAAQGVIARAAPTLSAFGRALSVWVELDNPHNKLKEGMLARMVITRQKPAPQTARAELTDDTKSPGGQEAK